MANVELEGLISEGGELHAGLKSLGESGTTYKFDEPDKSLLETFPNPAWLEELNPKGADMTIEIVAPEFTSLCPKTGQPDYATIVVNYAPRRKCLESKSWKLYLNSFRNHGCFHESIVNQIANDLIELLDPEMLVVQGQFTPRGGIKFWPTSGYERGAKNRRS